MRGVLSRHKDSWLCKRSKVPWGRSYYTLSNEYTKRTNQSCTIPAKWNYLGRYSIWTNLIKILMFVYDIISASGIVNIIIETHYAINYENLQDSCNMVSFQMILHMGYIDVHLHIRLWRNSHQSEPFCGKWARDTKSALHCFCLSVCLVFFIALTMNTILFSLYIASELVGPRYRLRVGTTICFAHCVGCILIVGVAYAVRSRFYLELVPTVTTMCILPLFW